MSFVRSRIKSVRDEPWTYASSEGHTPVQQHPPYSCPPSRSEPHIHGSTCTLHSMSNAAAFTHMKLNHLDFQVCIYDRRQSGFNRSPCVQFGYRPPAGKFNKPETRYTRGSVQYAHYVRGHKDGTVKLWDFRNIRVMIICSIFRQIRLMDCLSERVSGPGMVSGLRSGPYCLLRAESGCHWWSCCPCLECPSLTTNIDTPDRRHRGSALRT